VSPEKFLITGDLGEGGEEDQEECRDSLPVSLDRICGCSVCIQRERGL